MALPRLKRNPFGASQVQNDGQHGITVAFDAGDQRGVRAGMR